MYFIGYHAEALAGLAGARGLDGGIEREQVGLPGDLLDELGQWREQIQLMHDAVHALLYGATTVFALPLIFDQGIDGLQIAVDLRIGVE
ncbi:MAG: hypothetical protein BWY49_00080 [Candidatus Omnitrophica bacterium ADurb.Bin314]|nr:MAG: hypothetical protein BWY49_00080 [Candidatus Omnitrophica bacterium ADurb.Bin314]